MENKELDRELMRRVELATTGADVHTVQGRLGFYVNMGYAYGYWIDMTPYYKEADKFFRSYLYDRDVKNLVKNFSWLYNEIQKAVKQAKLKTKEGCT